MRSIYDDDFDHVLEHLHFKRRSRTIKRRFFCMMILITLVAISALLAFALAMP